MEAVVTAITTAVTPASLFAGLATIVPIIAVGLGVGFTLSLARRATHKLGKGKGGF